MRPATAILSLIAANELWSDWKRNRSRKTAFDAASRRATELRRPLLVVGDPDTGIRTRIARAYGCGDLCVDLTGCPLCPVGYARDLTKGVPEIPANSVVVFCSCVLEYVPDPRAAWHEMVRMAGSPENVFLVTVQPTTLTGVLYPGARWWVARDGDGGVDAVRVPWAAKGALAAQLVGLGITALRR